MIAETRSHFPDSNIFNFELTNPDEDEEYRKSSGNNIAIIDNVSNSEFEHVSLSSGEKVILFLIMLSLENRQGNLPPKLVLLDELDTSLHPSMIKVLLKVIDKVFIERGTKVILATHSPTTVSLVDECAIHVVNHGMVKNKIDKTSKSEALNILTEGYVTLNDGTKLLHSLSDKYICILTEGHNAKILQRLLEINNIKDVEVIDSIIDKSSKSQLKTYGEFLKQIPHNSTVLIVWDNDANLNKKIRDFKDERNTYGLIIPDNPHNTIAPKGIENAFMENCFEGFTIDCIKKNGTPRRFDTNRKAEFAEMVCKSEDTAIFAHLQCVIDKINDIKKQATEKEKEACEV